MSKLEYFVMDVETSIKNRGDEAIGKFKASPHNPINEVVMAGCASNRVTKVNIVPRPLGVAQTEGALLVGHNVAFDLLYHMRLDGWREWLKTGRIWDTMLVEYLLSGQQDKYASLDQCSAKYGGTLKSDKIKEYWNNDIDTEDIPKAELREYLENDVKNTEIVFLKQLEEAAKLDMLPLIHTQMEARLATLEMEYNGIHADRGIIQAEGSLLAVDLDMRVDIASSRMAISYPIECEDINPMSPKQLGEYLFGGERKYVVRSHMLDDDGNIVKFKSGKKKGEARYKNVQETCTVKGKIPHATLYSTQSGSNGAWTTGEQVLKDVIKDSTVDIVHRTFCTEMLKLRELQKDYKTYFVGYEKLIWPDGCIHANFQHCSTDTGRLSCNSPNLQQLTH